MKYLKTYNESLRDKMKPKSDEDILNSLKNLPDEKILSESVKNNFFAGIKYVLDKDIDFNSNSQTFNLHRLYDFLVFNDNKEQIKYILYNKNLNGFLSENFIYVVEKYKLGLHQNENKDFEIYLNDVFNKLEIEEKYDFIDCKLDSKIIFLFGKTTKTLTYDYNFILDFFRKYVVFTISLKILMVYLVEKKLKLKVEKIKSSSYIN